jgi:hypothetical protein
MALPDGARIAIVVLCLCAVSFLLRVLVAIAREMLILRKAEMHGELIVTKLAAQPRRERLVVIDEESLQRRFGTRTGSRRV